MAGVRKPVANVAFSVPSRHRLFPNASRGETDQPRKPTSPRTPALSEPQSPRHTCCAYSAAFGSGAAVSFPIDAPEPSFAAWNCVMKLPSMNTWAPMVVTWAPLCFQSHLKSGSMKGRKLTYEMMSLHRGLPVAAVQPAGL